jgi:hypothetical protein
MTYEPRALQRTSALRVIAIILLLTAGSRAAAQTPAQQIDFSRPEAWALKYFSAVSTFTAIGPPVVREAGSIDFGLEGGWIPHLSESERRVGFRGTALEDLNKTPLFGRPRLTVGLPAGFSVEAAWVPPIVVNGGEASLFAAALERPFVVGTPWALGFRLYGQLGHAKGDFTCPEDVVAQPPGSSGNPQSCDARSADSATLNNAGAALTGGVKVAGGGTVHFAIGGQYNDLVFQVGAHTAGVADNTRLATHGWTGWVAAGAGWPLGKAASIAAEAYYSPLLVRRPPDTDTQNDGLFNVRALVRFHLR